MAERRMISKKITDTDAFLDMPLSTQALYFHFVQNADDDGFVGSPNSIIRKIGANRNDYDLLIAKRFVIPFESGVCVIKHWRIHNYIQSDRYNPTTYLDEKATLFIEENKAYTQNETKCIQNVYTVDTQVSIGKDSIDKVSINKDIVDEESSTLASLKNPPLKETKHKYGEYKNILLKDSELEQLKKDFDNYEELIKYLDEYIEMKGTKYKSHYLAIRKWVVSAVKEQGQKQSYKGKNEHNFMQRKYGDGSMYDDDQKTNIIFDDIDDVEID